MRGCFFSIERTRFLVSGAGSQSGGGFCLGRSEGELGLVSNERKSSLACPLQGRLRGRCVGLDD